MDDVSPLVLAVGDFSTAEMRPVLEALNELSPAARVRRALAPMEAVRLVQTGPYHADLVLVALARPDAWSPATVSRLLALLPLARYVCAYGLWCESDGRTRSVWPLAVRIPARRAENRIRSELDVLAGRRSPLPLTASRDEICEFDFTPERRAVSHCRKIASIHSPDGPLGNLIADVLTRRGYRALIGAGEPDRGGHVDIVVWDADPLTRARADELKTIARAQRDAPIVAVMNHPRPEDVEALTALGARSVVDKLSPISAFADAIAKCA